MNFFSSLSIQKIILLRLFLAVVAAGAGSCIAIAAKKISHLTLCVLISFAAGALLAVSIFDIIPEAYRSVGFVGAGISALSGYILFYVITKFIFHICPACAATHTEVNFTALTWAMVIALSIHSFMDGLAIYSGCAVSSRICVPILAAVVLHKMPEGLALTLVARTSGISRPKSFFLACGLEALTTLSGGMIGLLFLLPGNAKWIGFVLGHVAGGFIFLVIHALLSEAIKHHPKSTILAAVLGAFLIGAVTLIP